MSIVSPPCVFGSLSVSLRRTQHDSTFVLVESTVPFEPHVFAVTDVPLLVEVPLLAVFMRVYSHGSLIAVFWVVIC